jgi:hypothetical protein
MPKIEHYIKDFRYIVLICFILFSLSPCTLKEALSNSVNADYAKPLNKLKRTAPISSCTYSQNESLQISVVKKTKINKNIEPVDFLGNSNLEIRSAKFYDDYSKTSSGNSPPKYILYKRLKIDIA